MVYESSADSLSEDLIKRLLSVALECKAFYTRLGTLSNHMMSTRKENEIEVNFDALIYNSISGFRQPSVSTEADSMNVKEIKIRTKGKAVG